MAPRRELRIQSADAGQVMGLTVSHPCDAPALWDAILQVVRERHGVCYWPGGAVIATPGTGDHLPEEVRASLGSLIVVSNCAHIAEAVADS
jgi:hypothetical protein